MNMSTLQPYSLNCNGFISLGLQGSRKSDVLEGLYSTSVFFSVALRAFGAHRSSVLWLGFCALGSSFRSALVK